MKPPRWVANVSPWLLDRRFLAILFVGTLTSLVRWFEMLVVGVYVFAATGSATLTAVMSALRVVPLALFGAFGGAVSDRFDRRRLMQWSLAAMCALSAGLAGLAWSGRIEIWHLGAAAFASGVFWIMDFPVRRALIGEVIPSSLLGRAMGVDTITNNGTRMLGPLAGGALLVTVGLEGTFAISSVLYALSLLSCYPVRFQPPRPETRRANVWRSFGEGIRRLRRDRNLAAILSVTVVFNLWAFPMVAMIPVVGEEQLGLGPSGVGLLASAEGAGALVGSFLIAVLARPVSFVALYFGGCAAFVVFSIGFAASPIAWLAGVMLLSVGLGGAGYAAMQTTLVLFTTPAEVRGRMLGVLSACIGTSPIGFYHVGLLADWLGAPDAIALIGLEGLIALVVVSLVWPELHRRGGITGARGRARNPRSAPPADSYSAPGQMR